MLYAITDRRLMGRDPVARIAALFEELGPRAAVQIREKDLAARALFEWCVELLPVAARCGGALFINGRVDLVRCLAGLHLHLPEDGVPIEEARALLGAAPMISAAVHGGDRVGADLALISPVFPTPSKVGPWLGVDGFAARAAVVRGRGGLAIALGGVEGANAADLYGAGADGVAAIRAVWVGGEGRALAGPLSSVLAERIRARHTALGSAPT